MYAKWTLLKKTLLKNICAVVIPKSPNIRKCRCQRRERAQQEKGKTPQRKVLHGACVSFQFHYAHCVFF
jgi:hypothetical protein